MTSTLRLDAVRPYTTNTTITMTTTDTWIAQGAPTLHVGTVDIETVGHNLSLPVNPLLTAPDRLVRRDRRDSFSSSSDSDSSASSSRRCRKPKVRPCGSVCRPNPPLRKASSSSDEHYDSATEHKERLKRRKDNLLTAGLATITTVAAGNGIYQNTKLYHARKNAMQDGEMCSHELEKLKTKATLMNLFSVGVVAIGLNNVRLGWMRHENTKKANREAERAAWERMVGREEREGGRRDVRDERY